MELLVAIIINVLTAFPKNTQKDTIFLSPSDFTVIEDSGCYIRLQINSDTLSSRIVQSPEAVIVFSIDSKKYIAKGKHPFLAASDPSNCNAYFCYYKDQNVSIQKNVLTLHTCFDKGPDVQIKHRKHKPINRRRYFQKYYFPNSQKYYPQKSQ